MTTNSKKTMITVRNTNPQFGDAGPFHVESVDALTEEMQDTFRRWAVEEWDAMADEDRDGDREVWIAENVAATSADFAAGLEIIESTMVSVDEECNAEEFWDRARLEAAHCPVPRFGEWLKRPCYDAITLDADEVAVVMSWLVELPGWSDPEYPAHAQHPLCFS